MLDAKITTQLDPELAIAPVVDPRRCCALKSNVNVFEILSKRIGFKEKTKLNPEDVPEIIRHRTELSDRHRVNATPVSSDRIACVWSA
jgi:hypothetical protein